MSKIKRLCYVLLVSLMMLNYGSVCCNAIAIEDDEILPCYTNVNVATISLLENNGRIEVEVRLEGSSGTTYEGGILTLRRTVGSETVFLENLRNLSSSTTVYSYYNNSHDATSGTDIYEL